MDLISKAYKERDKAIYSAFKPADGSRGKKQREIALESGLSLSRVKAILAEQKKLRRRNEFG